VIICQSKTLFLDALMVEQQMHSPLVVVFVQFGTRHANSDRLFAVDPYYHVLVPKFSRLARVSA
jgi:hypothetical protein